MSDVYLEVDNVSVSFQTAGRVIEAVRDANFTVRRGEFIALLGPSGCGKTTLLHAIGGLTSISEGAIRCEGTTVNEPGPERIVVFQEFSLFKWRTARGNVEFGLECKRIPSARRREITETFLRLVGLDEFMDAYPHQLSGGMKQRVALARALAYDSELLLMDEPFASLDAQNRIVMQSLLLRIWDQLHKTVVFVTHDIDEAIFLSDRIIVMSARPGTIKSEFKISAPRPRTLEYLITPEFMEVKRQVFRSVQLGEPHGGALNHESMRTFSLMTRPIGD